MLTEKRSHADILQLFENAKLQDPGFLRVSAPMVRYSKYEFRQLLRQQGVQLTFTPMIIADSFNNSEKARLNEFTTSVDDQPVIAQFAAANAQEFSQAAQLIYPYVDGVDLNCGCPQSWAMAKQYGCGLIRHPEIVEDIIKTTRRCLPQNFSISVKMRLIKGESTIESTTNIARQLEHCGASFLTLHGRHNWQSASDEVQVDVIAAVKKAVNIPLIANGNVRSWQDACDLYELTNADGIMAARGLLTNPCLFNEDCREHNKTSFSCVQQWLDLCGRAGDNIQFQCFHHHLIFMWSNNMQKNLRAQFNYFTKKQQIYDFFTKHYNLRTREDSDTIQYTTCNYEHFKIQNVKKPNEITEWQENTTQGKFFNEFVEERDEFELENSFFADVF